MPSKQLHSKELDSKELAHCRSLPGRTALRCRVSLLACLLLVGLLGCREHPRVTSRASLDLIKQVYTACNTQNNERLTKCKEEIAELVESGELSAAERESFERIIALADSGDWQAAAAKSLQFARDQVR